jgi:hypothetical protein
MKELLEKRELRLKAEILAPRIEKFLKKREQATTSQIAVAVGSTFEETHFALKELERKGRIVID